MNLLAAVLMILGQQLMPSEDPELNPDDKDHAPVYGAPAGAKGQRGFASPVQYQGQVTTSLQAPTPQIYLTPGPVYYGTPYGNQYPMAYPYPYGSSTYLYNGYAYPSRFYGVYGTNGYPVWHHGFR